MCSKTVNFIRQEVVFFLHVTVVPKQKKYRESLIFIVLTLYVQRFSQKSRRILRVKEHFGKRWVNACLVRSWRSCQSSEEFSRKCKFKFWLPEQKKKRKFYFSRIANWVKYKIRHKVMYLCFFHNFIAILTVLNGYSNYFNTKKCQTYW